ncbi:MAG: hypothetical protein JXJ18_10170 [Rhodobacteraceae bacterium]|nr:hypothetical protein [Paracoccaceae bacterium]
MAIVSLRNVDNHVSRSHGYEFEDIIAEKLDNADIYAPRPGSLWPYLSKVRNRVSYRTKAVRALPTDLNSPSLERDYDILFYSVAQLRDLNVLDAVGNWRKRSNCAICWIQELWNHDFETLGTLVERLNDFDLVICSFADTTDTLRRRLGVPVRYIPWGVDAIAFCPLPNPPRRAIDVLSIGVRHEQTHAALIDHADRTGQYYSYETISGRAGMRDHRAHRHNYIGQLKRSRYFFSYLAKVERTEERGPQTEFGLRYIEGLAVGAVILGTRIENDAFEKHLGWTDSVIPVPYACPDIGATITAMDAQPERLATIRRRNIAQCLSRHDHLYRWQGLLDFAGLAGTPGMDQRKQQLDALIAQAQSEDIHEVGGISSV